MGGDGSPGGLKAMVGMHDWIGFTQSLDGWSIVDEMTFKLTFTTYYEAVLRELFRETSETLSSLGLALGGSEDWADRLYAPHRSSATRLPPRLHSTRVLGCTRLPSRL